MKSSAMDTSIFSPVYSMDSSPAPLSSPLTDNSLRRQLDQESPDDDYHQGDDGQQEEGGLDDVQDDDEQEHRSIIHDRLCQDDGSNGPDLTQLSTRIHLDIPHILDPSEPEAPQGEK